MASKRLGWALAGLALLGGCNRGPSQAELDSLAQVQLQARRDSIAKVRATRDSLARVRYQACTDSVRKALMRTAAGRAKLRVRVPEGQPRPENTAACGPMPAAAPATTTPATTTTPAAAKPSAPATTPATTPAASPAPRQAAAPTAQQQRVARADSVRQARERARADSLARLAERRRADSIAQARADSVRADSLARARETEVLRETFSYSGASRDPFRSVVAAGSSGPTVNDLQLVTIMADQRSARNSVAVLRERQGTRRYRVKVGDKIGSATVTLITPSDVTFTIQDFGFERQETLSLRKASEDTP